jgi:hypothetical protein
MGSPDIQLCLADRDVKGFSSKSATSACEYDAAITTETGCVRFERSGKG